MSERVAVIGLGYVGLPVALGFAAALPGTVGFDPDRARVEELRRHHDRNGETPPERLRSAGLEISADSEVLEGATFFVICVPTPIDAHRRPDLEPLQRACAKVGPFVRKGAVVVFESTVYPGATEEECGPALEAASGLVCGRDFHLGYSPERINPGDPKHTLETIVKIVAGQDEATLDRVAAAYGLIVPAGLHRAPSIRVAEAAKVLENTQRDINIALMNELAMICNRLDLRTADVIAAAATKWNFVPFRPGLVGGHCVGVDPYWLAAKAERMGEHPQMILAGRRINDGMGGYVAREVARRLARSGRPIGGARIGIAGVTFKADVADIRNSRVPDIVAELRSFGMDVLLTDPLADPKAVEHEFGMPLVPMESLGGLDALVVAAPHAQYRGEGRESLFARIAEGGLLVDVASAFAPTDVPASLSYWSL